MMPVVYLDEHCIDVPVVPPRDIKTPGRGVPGRRDNAIKRIESIDAERMECWRRRDQPCIEVPKVPRRDMKTPGGGVYIPMYTTL